MKYDPANSIRLNDIQMARLERLRNVLFPLHTFEITPRGKTTNAVCAIKVTPVDRAGTRKRPVEIAVTGAIRFADSKTVLEFPE